MRRLALLLVTLLALPALVPASADAAGGDAAGHGRPWPKHRITYVDRTLDHEAVQLAIHAWNTSGLHIRFVPARKGHHADVIIRNSRRVPGGCGTGLAQLGYVRGHQSFVNILHGTDDRGQACAWPGQALVVTHELGHVLGLPHLDRSCSIMNDHHVNGVAPFRCLGSDITDAKPGRWWCQLLAPPELKILKRWYGGHPHVSPTTWCDASPRIPATGAISVKVGSYRIVSYTLQRAPEPAVPGWLGTWGYGAPGYEVHVTPNTCTAIQGDVSTEVAADPWGTVAIGGTRSGQLGQLAPGRYCVTAWQYDQGTNYALTPSTAMVTVT